MNLPAKEEVIAAIKELAVRLGRTPSFNEIKRETKLTDHQLQRLFGSRTQLQQECGLEPVQRVPVPPMDELFREWAKVVRTLARVPTCYEYRFYTQRNPGVLSRRFEYWRNVPSGLKAYAEHAGLWAEWPDVLSILNAAEAEKWPVPPVRDFCPAVNTAPPAEEDWMLPAAPMYGPPVVSPALANAPINELGVIYLFGTLAAELGYMVLRVQAGFPDCEAMRRIEGDRWQRLLIEFEYASRNFLLHKHDAAKCDLIVCWVHNWPECPVRVLELSKFVAQR